MKKAVLYARVSSDRQEKEGYSIPAQKKLLQSYAEDNGITILQEFVESETAKKSGRTEFNNMIKFLKKNLSCKIILVEKTDRLYRNLKDYVTLDDFEGLEIHFVKEGNILSANSRSQDKFMHGIRVLMAKNYIDNLSEEIRKGLKEKAEQGYCPTRAPIGYKNVQLDTGKRVIELDTVQAPFVKMVFEKYLLGNYTYSSLAREMNKLGFRPKNKLCTHKTIENILHQEFYCGNFIFREKKYYNGKHTPIISHELFNAVKEKLSKNRVAPEKVNEVPYLKYIKCSCGRYMSADVQHGAHNSGTYVYYRCRHCKIKTLKKDLLEELFKENVLSKLRFTEEEIREVVEITKDLVTKETSFVSTSAEELAKRVKVLEKRLSNLYDDRADGMISRELFQKKVNEYTAELDEVLIRLEKVNKSQKTFLIDLDNLLNLCKEALSLYEGANEKEKEKIMKLVCANPIYDGSKIVFTLHTAFQHALNVKNMVSVGSVPNSVNSAIIDLFNDYQNIDFNSIRLFLKCA